MTFTQGYLFKQIKVEMQYGDLLSPTGVFLLWEMYLVFIFFDTETCI